MRNLQKIPNNQNSGHGLISGKTCFGKVSLALALQHVVQSHIPGFSKIVFVAFRTGKCARHSVLCRWKIYATHLLLKCQLSSDILKNLEMRQCLPVPSEPSCRSSRHSNPSASRFLALRRSRVIQGSTRGATLERKVTMPPVNRWIRMIAFSASRVGWDVISLERDMG